MSEELKPQAAAPATPQAAPQAPAAAPKKPAAPAAAAPAAPAENDCHVRTIERAAFRKEMERLHKEEHMDFLECLTGIDREDDGLAVIYHLESTATGKRTCVQVVCEGRETPNVPTVSDLWDIANIYEREV